jgi:hypothetical protein
MSTKVTGPALLQLADQYANGSKAELCRAAGYEAIDKNGKARPDYASLQNAMLAAHGHGFAANVRPRSSNYELAVTKAGLLTVGKSYLSSFNATEGSVFRVKVEADKIILTFDPTAAPLGPTASDAASTNGAGTTGADLDDIVEMPSALRSQTPSLVTA